MNFRNPQYSNFPPVVKNLLILNGLFFLATIALESTYNFDLREYLGLRYPFSSEFKPYQLITYMFMHGGFWHLFVNMFGLWMFGKGLEQVWGSKRFLTFYMVSGIVAGLVHYLVFYLQIAPQLDLITEVLKTPSLDGLMQIAENSPYVQITSDQFAYYKSMSINNPDGFSNMLTNSLLDLKEVMVNRTNVVGASGSLFGILLGAAVLFPNSMVYIYMAFPLKMKYFVILYALFELYNGVAGSNDGIAHFAHLGGMVGGFILLYKWGYFKR